MRYQIEGDICLQFSGQVRADSEEEAAAKIIQRLGKGSPYSVEIYGNFIGKVEERGD